MLEIRTSWPCLARFITHVLSYSVCPPPSFFPPTTGCIFESNYATMGGGAMISGFPLANMSDVDFTTNRALASGGGLMVFQVSQANIVESIFTANEAIGNQ